MDTLDSTLYLSDDDLFLLARGEWYRSYEKLGAHPARTEDGVEGFHFAVWAPDVESVHVIGDFNGWDETANKKGGGNPRRRGVGVLRHA